MCACPSQRAVQRAALWHLCGGGQGEPGSWAARRALLGWQTSGPRPPGTCRWSQADARGLGHSHVYSRLGRRLIGAPGLSNCVACEPSARALPAVPAQGRARGRARWRARSPRCSPRPSTWSTRGCRRAAAATARTRAESARLPAAEPSTAHSRGASAPCASRAPASLGPAFAPLQVAGALASAPRYSGIGDAIARIVREEGACSPCLNLRATVSCPWEPPRGAPPRRRARALPRLAAARAAVHAVGHTLLRRL